jgi:type II secretory pathway pseudopilin PulG
MKIIRLKALGFVEVIIAIVVVGVMSTVFLTMSGRAMRELVQTERLETMKRVARDGAQIAQEVANRQKNALPGEEYFPTELMRCYIPVKDENGYSMKKDINGDFISESLLEVIIIGPGYTENDFSLRDWAIENAVYENFEDSSDYFLVMCINDIDDEGTRWANVYFWVGDIHVKGELTSDTDMKDFKYYAIIDL